MGRAPVPKQIRPACVAHLLSWAAVNISPDGSYAPASSILRPASPYRRLGLGAHPAVTAVPGAAAAFLSLLPRPDPRRPRSRLGGPGTRRRRCRGRHRRCRSRSPGRRSTECCSRPRGCLDAAAGPRCRMEPNIASKSEVPKLISS
ncbi:uncharacterized protein LOC120688656 [Panicum virgatum]|uniref:uncharacterized protein LOC120688656 n=1 Tax=Panicum virgatum TaxID=38727 RepID=UPI0019D56CAA|nr:uncharacterized protein LOC120688656 [Panicum virgatum]